MALSCFILILYVIPEKAGIQAIVLNRLNQEFRLLFTAKTQRTQRRLLIILLPASRSLGEGWSFPRLRESRFFNHKAHKACPEPCRREHKGLFIFLLSALDIKLITNVLSFLPRIKCGINPEPAGLACLTQGRLPAGIQGLIGHGFHGSFLGVFHCFRHSESGAPARQTEEST
ncbi:MAG: hypothetical protein A2509_12100 [Candidatus Edwardsbacteria bacterium RIFOXYD12_FULL_50_11]|uniref:Uncharacterized protein n=1 Tax=Candidatus Edwardsbacteria bacterium GWF2_54_11 TaxID=1817851 RepID=A0A1F5R424_9BACT|nr:MAG: hypothetical protein A2024_04490 [Candidatus Edwardsbacteria bacterium GWF2_54_11]OGF11380.1 MAG: hypothetical protein A3K15_03410 [Candidatus Edwardsbacteria bacterium GWE2_54_12]OGF16858.1 MAG: hypothetical protein A2509_12100 [Candidatus Edwardsbacteria bacterium RIFOXYD12_FULL_50_11]